MKIVDLTSARTANDALVFAGRDRGKYFRSLYKLDDLDREAEQIKIVIPPQVIAVNISFFLSMFGKSVRELGKEQFKNHYLFQVNPHLDGLINLGIDQAVKTSSVLSE